MRLRFFKILGILTLMATSLFYMSRHENIFQKASLINLTGPAQLRFSKNKYQLKFQKLSSLDELKIETELKKIHQITEKISQTSISSTGEIMITLAKSMDNNIVLVIFKNQQIQMVQKVLRVTDQTIAFQYGEIEFFKENKPATQPVGQAATQPETPQLASGQNVELEF